MSDATSFDPLSLDIEDILAEARAIAGSDDFGDESFREPFQRLVESLDREAELNAVGRGMQHARMVGLLVNRLRTEAWIACHPEILEERIAEPIVIVGLPRTGTTMLQRMIASDPENHFLYWWETRLPAPLSPPEEPPDPEKRDPRIDDAEAEVAAMLENAPDLMAIHPLEAEGPDEEAMLLEHSFLSTNPEAFVNVPSFMAWADEQDQRSSYLYLERLLKFLQWQKKRRGEAASRWVLKAPHHLGFMHLLFDVFPDARVVQTHRDPMQTIPSLASFIQTIRAMGSDNADPRVTGRQWSDRMSRAMRRCIEVRKEHEDRFFDVFFTDVLDDPIDVIRRIYAFAGWELTEEAVESMRQWAVDNARDKREAHSYTLEEFGLDEEGIRRDFAEYRKRFVPDA